MPVRIKGRGGITETRTTTGRVRFEFTEPFGPRNANGEDSEGGSAVRVLLGDDFMVGALSQRQKLFLAGRPVYRFDCTATGNPIGGW